MAELVERLVEKMGGSPCVRELILAAQKGELCVGWDSHASIPSSLLSEGHDENAFPHTPLVFQKDRLYLQRNWTLETLIISQTKRLLCKIPLETSQKLEFQELLNRQKGVLSPSQFEAIEQAFLKSFAIFAGGPGTGKTYTAAHLIRVLASLHTKYKVAIAAPTGKAASRLEEVLLGSEKPESLICQTATLHRLLGLRPGSHRLGRTKRLDFDLIVIDEASMLDHLLMAHLLEAIPENGRLLLLGDSNQLPPVESGSLFSEMAHLFGSFLTQSHRMEKGTLQEVAELICKQDAEQALQRLKTQGCWIPWEEISIQRLADWLKPEGRRILSPLRKGPFGVDQLNQGLKQALRWQAIPILIKQNDPKNQLWNGMSGVLQNGVAKFGDRSIPLGMLPLYEEAFCLSIHKSQGSEYDEVLVVFPPGAESFGKEALYTAITRARKKVIVASTEDTIRSALAQEARKRSGFSDRVKL